MESNAHVWHREVIDEQVERALESLRGQGILDHFYLAGGTGLALHLGHRRSHDLDFMSPDPVDADALIRTMKTLAGFALASKAPDTLHVTVQGVKVSLLAYPYRLLFPPGTFLGANVADPRDIACMKLSAIASRGTRRDFVDVYLVAREYGVEQLLDWYKEKYAEVNHSLTHLRKSLTWFADADEQPMPDMLVSLLWEDVKRFFTEEVSRLAR